MIKRVVARVLLGPTRIPQYEPVGLQEPQTQVTVMLRGPGPPIDVTHNNVIASLRPLRIAVTLPAERAALLGTRDRVALTFHDRERSEPAIGIVTMALAGSLPLADQVLCLFRSTGHTNRCLPQWRLLAHYANMWRNQRRSRDPHNFTMPWRDLHSFLVLYTCPRPVAFISVQAGIRSNLFPMDLIGPTGTPHFLLALRSTSPAIALMQESGRVALSRVPAELTPVAYQLGRHHKLASIDLMSLPFPLDSSVAFGLPVPRPALGVVDLQIEASHVVGSHVLFVARPVHDQHRREGARMFHVQGFYQDYLRRRGRPLPGAG